MKTVRTEAEIKRTRRRFIALIVAFVALVFALTICWNLIHASLREQAAGNLHDRIVETANQCYAIEGAYPISLQYLEDKYGLVIDYDDYSVSYDIYATNIAPKVKVVAR